LVAVPVGMWHSLILGLSKRSCVFGRERAGGWIPARLRRTLAALPTTQTAARPPPARCPGRSLDIGGFGAGLRTGSGRSALHPGLDGLTHLFVDVLPVLDRIGQHRLLDTVGEAADDGLDETLALFLGVDLADQRVCLTEVVVLGMQAVGAADELAVGLPAVVDRALRLLVGASVRVRGVDRSVARVVVLHLAFLVIRIRLRDRGVDRQLVEV